MSPNFPCGIEVLLKKASLDPEFCTLLLDTPEQAAQSIDLTLDPMEQAMLAGMPREQLAVVIRQTTVPNQQRRAFLGTTAAAMLAVLASSQSSMAGMPPDQSRSRSGRIRPDTPEDRARSLPQEISIETELRQAVAKLMQLEEQQINDKTRLRSKNMKNFLDFRQEIKDRFDVRMPVKTLQSLKTFQLLLVYLSDSRTEYRDDSGTYGIIPAEKQPNEVS